MRNFINIISLFVVVQSVMAQTNLTTAIDFEKKNIHGDTIRLFELLDAGQYVVIDFFFVDCTPCQGISPFVNQSYHDFGCNEGDVYFMSISGHQGDTDEECEAYDETYGVDYPTISGAAGGFKTAGMYGISNYPTVILIAPDHSIIEQFIWPINSVDDMSNPLLAANCNLQDCPTGVEENDIFSFSLYPNPTNDMLNLQFPDAQKRTLSIFNVLGEKVYQENTKNSKLVIKINNLLESGVYFVSIEQNGKIVSQKIIIK